MAKIKAIIEKSEDGGYSVYAIDVQGAAGYGETDTEAKTDFLSVLEEQAEYYTERTGKIAEWAKDGYEIEYRYDFSGFFQAFPFVNISAFAEMVGINPSLMRKYKAGLATASEKQKQQIQGEFDKIVHRLQAVQF